MIKTFIRFIFYALCIGIITWLLVSWFDVLLHNDPVTGDKTYWQGNAFVLMIGGRNDI